MTLLQRLSYGIVHFHTKNGYFPWEDPRLTSDRFKHSWRVVLLPALEKEHPAEFAGATELWQKYRFNEAWDSPHNHRLALEASNYYSLDRSSSLTSICAIDSPSEELNPRQAIEFETTGVFLIHYEPWAAHWMNPHNPSQDQVEILLDQVERTSDENAYPSFMVVTTDGIIYRGSEWREYKQSEARHQAWLKSKQRKAEQKSNLVDESSN